MTMKTAKQGDLQMQRLIRQQSVPDSSIADSRHTIGQTELAVAEVLALLFLLNHLGLLLHLLEEVGQGVQGNLLCLVLGDCGRQVGHNSLQGSTQAFESCKKV